MSRDMERLREGIEHLELEELKNRIHEVGELLKSQMDSQQKQQAKWLLDELKDTALLRKHEPILHFSPEERFFPMDVQDFVASCELHHGLRWFPKLGLRVVAGQGDLRSKFQRMKDSPMRGLVGFLQYVTPQDVLPRPALLLLRPVVMGLWLLPFGIVWEVWRNPLVLTMGGAGFILAMYLRTVAWFLARARFLDRSREVRGLLVVVVILLGFVLVLPALSQVVGAARAPAEHSSIPILTTAGVALIVVGGCLVVHSESWLYSRPELSESDTEERGSESKRAWHAVEQRARESGQKLRELIADRPEIRSEKQNLFWDNPVDTTGRLDPGRTSFDSLATLLLLASGLVASLGVWIRPADTLRSSGLDWRLNVTLLLVMFTAAAYAFVVAMSRKLRKRQTALLVGTLYLSGLTILSFPIFGDRLDSLGSFNVVRLISIPLLASTAWSIYHSRISMHPQPSAAQRRALMALITMLTGLIVFAYPVWLRRLLGLRLDNFVLIASPLLVCLLLAWPVLSSLLLRWVSANEERSTFAKRIKTSWTELRLPARILLRLVVGLVAVVAILTFARVIAGYALASAIQWTARAARWIVAILFGYHIVVAVRRRFVLLNGVLGAISGFHDGTGSAAAAKYKRYLEGRLPSHRSFPYYGRVWRDPKSDYVVLQYWFFYPFNDWRTHYNGLDDHEGDWEHVDVFLKPEGEAFVPVYALLSQHISDGPLLKKLWADLDWDPDLKPEDRNHPPVYVAAGSHGNYHKRGQYSLPELLQPGGLGEKGLRWLVLKVLGGYDKVVDQTIVASQRSYAQVASRTDYVKRYHPDIRVLTAEQLLALDPSHAGFPQFCAQVNTYPKDLIEGRATLPRHAEVDKWITYVAYNMKPEELSGCSERISPAVETDVIACDSPQAFHRELRRRFRARLRFGLRRAAAVNTRDIIDYAAVGFSQEGWKVAQTQWAEFMDWPVVIGPHRRGRSGSSHQWECKLLTERACPWLGFKGRWGRYVIYPGETGPAGPSQKGEKWDDPLAWAGLRFGIELRLKDPLLRALEDALNRRQPWRAAELYKEVGSQYVEWDQTEHNDREKILDYYEGLLDEEQYRDCQFSVTPVRTHSYPRTEFWLEARSAGNLKLQRRDFVVRGLTASGQAEPRIAQHRTLEQWVPHETHAEPSSSIARHPLRSGAAE